MTPEALPPIPYASGHYWREFRMRFLPGLGFLGVMALAIWLWGKNLTNSQVVAQAESPQVEVASLKPGRLSKLNVKLFQEVRAGDALATIEIADPMIASNTIAKVFAEMNLLRATAGLSAGDRVRLADVRLSWMIRRTELAVAQARLKWAQSEYDRISSLAAEKFSSEFDLDVARRDWEQGVKEVEQRTLAVEAAEKTLQEIDPTTADPESPVFKATLALAEQQLRLAEAQLAPVILTAPISGRVSRLDTLAGSMVLAGAPIMTISSPTPDRITGFLSQPLRTEVKVGMKVEVRSRGLARRVGAAQVLEIGPRVVLFDAPFRVRGMVAAQERGLPFVMNVPTNLFLRPGELVDLRLIVN